MNHRLSVAVIGTGVSGLTIARELLKKQCKVTLFNRGKRIAGRAVSMDVQPGVVADMGANLIDFDGQVQQKRVGSFLDDVTGQAGSLREFKSPFLIYDNALKEADYYKPRYYYPGGFRSLSSNIAAPLLEHCQFRHKFTVNRLHRDEKGWSVIGGQDDAPSGEFFDWVVMGCEAAHTKRLLDLSKLQGTAHLIEKLETVLYTQQVSVAYELTKEAKDFSSVLFKNHPITFFCSHLEKYPNNEKQVVVVQTNEEFTKDLMDLTYEQIGERVKEKAPEELRPWLGEMLQVRKWKKSLIRDKKKADFTSFQLPHMGLYTVGQACYGASRVSGAIQSSLLLSEYLTQNAKL